MFASKETVQVFVAVRVCVCVCVCVQESWNMGILELVRLHMDLYLGDI